MNQHLEISAFQDNWTWHSFLLKRQKVVALQITIQWINAITLNSFLPIFSFLCENTNALVILLVEDWFGSNLSTPVCYVYSILHNNSYNTSCDLLLVLLVKVTYLKYLTQQSTTSNNFVKNKTCLWANKCTYNVLLATVSEEQDTRTQMKEITMLHSTRTILLLLHAGMRQHSQPNIQHRCNPVTV